MTMMLRPTKAVSITQSKSLPLPHPITNKSAVSAFVSARRVSEKSVKTSIKIVFL